MFRQISSSLVRATFPRPFPPVRHSAIALPKTRDLYEILGVRPSATQVEIKQAYYDLTLLYHPDRNDGSTEAVQKFREITEAYEILGNTLLRQRYDMNLPVTKPREVDYKDHQVKYQRFYESREARMAGKKAEYKYDEFFATPPPKPKDEFVFRNLTNEEFQAEKRVINLMVVIAFYYALFTGKLA